MGKARTGGSSAVALAISISIEKMVPRKVESCTGLVGERRTD